VFYTTGFNTGQVYAIRPDGSVAWKGARGAPQKPGLIFTDGLLFMVNDTGIVTCLDAANGTEIWRSRVSDSYSASPILAQGRIYFFSEDGRTSVIEAGREFRPLAQNTLDDGFMASPAIDGRALYLRTKSHLYRVEAR